MTTEKARISSQGTVCRGADVARKEAKARVYEDSSRAKRERGDVTAAALETLAARVSMCRFVYWANLGHWVFRLMGRIGLVIWAIVIGLFLDSSLM
ncbi:hypothetical protein ES332_D06G133700v1 [Gossypium tomentosum]|uniref:Uncharacterized protein n=1 Tax=Gossypium tomentosum TaxID=34277 RepID=A0A5D2KHG6_GOSTO|nr:hypothetical protein ES332_D06G133700v1 [Gossypium tomentosum]